MSSKQAKLILHRSGTQKTKKLAWINKSDPRLPSKAHIIRQTLQLLISNTHNEETFPSTTISSGNRKREDLGNTFKPTVPRFPRHGPHNKPRFFTCKCVAPVPTPRTTAVSKPGVNRTWSLKAHLTCTAPNVVDLLRCKRHPNLWNEGSAKNPKLR